MDSTQQSQSLTGYVRTLGHNASGAFREMSGLAPTRRVAVLRQLADQLQQDQQAVLTANRKDLALAQDTQLAPQLLDRLELTKSRYKAMIEGIHQVMNLPEPVGGINDLTPLPSGIRVGKMRVPLGVIAMIYESRPNVTIDAAALNLRVGNAVILRGGSESFHTNMALYQSIRSAVAGAGVPQHLVQLVEVTDRKAVDELVRMRAHVDLVIPRGGRRLIERVIQESQVNILKHLDGNCHVFVDRDADLEMAKRIVINAKTRRYGVCNALESLLVDCEIADSFFSTGVIRSLVEAGVTIRACERSRALGGDCGALQPATEQDWSTEYLAPIMSLKLVDHLDAAIAHINHYGSHHTDAIVTSNITHADTFMRAVDSSSVMVNASTAFADGFEYGLGAEIGISTDKFHARGPVGLEGLTSQKYVVLGQGEIRA